MSERSVIHGKLALDVHLYLSVRANTLFRNSSIWNLFAFQMGPKLFEFLAEIKRIFPSNNIGIRSHGRTFPLTKKQMFLRISAPQKI